MEKHDRDELDAAYENGDITKEQYDRTIQTADTLRRGLFKDYQKYESFVHERLNLIKG